MCSFRAQSTIKVGLDKGQSCANVRKDAFITLKNVSLHEFIWIYN